MDDIERYLGLEMSYEQIFKIVMLFFGKYRIPLSIDPATTL